MSRFWGPIAVFCDSNKPADFLVVSYLASAIFFPAKMRLPPDITKISPACRVDFRLWPGHREIVSYALY
jgi:hypothetical protein